MGSICYSVMISLGEVRPAYVVVARSNIRPDDRISSNSWRPYLCKFNNRAQFLILTLLKLAARFVNPGNSWLATLNTS